MEGLRALSVQLTAVCALSAATELLLPEGAKKKGVRFLTGLMAAYWIARAALGALGGWE